MTKVMYSVLGGVVLVIGLVFTFQGLGVLKGSAMTGETQWAIIGPIVALVGLALIAAGSRRRT